MRKNAYALGFASVGLGVGLWISADSGGYNLAVIAMCVAFGIFLGYFVAGLLGAKSTILQENFKSLGAVPGKSLDEIVAVVGPPRSRQAARITDRDNAPGHLCTWCEDQYSVTLLFDAEFNCIGITNEICTR